MKRLKAILHDRKVQYVFFWCVLWLPTLTALCLWLLWDAGFRFNSTPSTPTGVYRLSSAPPKHGDTVAYCLRGEAAELARQRGYLTEGSCPSGLCPVLKTVAGLPGDTLSQGIDGLRVNGLLQPHSAVLPFDSHGRSMAGALLPPTVPEGMAVLLSDHAGGFDSRYFGLVPLADLRRYTPVFTF